MTCKRLWVVVHGHPCTAWSLQIMRQHQTQQLMLKPGDLPVRFIFLPSVHSVQSVMLKSIIVFCVYHHRRLSSCLVCVCKSYVM